MRFQALAITLAVFAAACMAPLAFAQPGTIFNYTIHVDFFAYSCSLSVTEVSLYDSPGNVIGTASSPYGGEVVIPLSSQTPITTLTAVASGQASWSSYNWPVDGSRSITLGTTGDYWITITMN